MKRLAILSMICFMAGCGLYATIHKNDGAALETRIEGSDASNIYISGCRNVLVPNPGGGVQKVEMHCDSDSKPEATQIYHYENGNVSLVEVDVCADGKVDFIKTYSYDDSGRQTGEEGERLASAEMNIGLIENKPCDYRKGDGRMKGIAIARSRIRDIDHPGDVGAIISTIIGSLGWIAILSGGSWCVANGSDFLCGAYNGLSIFSLVTISGAVLAIPGTVAAVERWYVWTKSRRAAYPPARRRRVSIIPVALIYGEKAYWGLGMSWRW